MGATQLNCELFDREFTLAELLDPKTAAKLQQALDAMLGLTWRVDDMTGNTLLGGTGIATVQTRTVPLLLDIEQIGSLIASDGAGQQINAAVHWIELTLTSARRYQMVASLHVAAINADYEALQRKHAALLESEQQYRDLAAQLERRVAEQVEVISRAQRQLYQTEKMASVGSLAAGMAHEINNPIGFIRSNINSAAKYFDQMGATLLAYRQGDSANAMRLWQEAGIDFIVEDAPGLLKECMDGADRIARIVANLMRYATIDYAVSARIELNDSVRAVANIIADQVREGIKLDLQLNPLPMIDCDQGRINQMLLSIMQNAVLAISGEGSITVTTGVVNDEIRIAITDTGCGIAPEALPRIFDPFYTTRVVGKGTGLGLTVCSDIAAAHDGRIEVVSTVGVGSTLTVCLPIHQRADKRANQGTSAGAVQ